MEVDVLSSLTQFGTAGLIAWMWLSERRQAAAKEEQLGEAHRGLMEQRVQLDQLLGVVADNTRAVTALESGQRRLTDLLDRLAGVERPAPAPVRAQPAAAQQ